MHVQNIERVWDAARSDEVSAGQQAYPKYQRITTQVAAKHGFSPTIGAAVFAALSPNSDYWGNLRDTDRLLAAAAAGADLTSFSVSTYGNNKRKAWHIANGGDPDLYIKVLKTRNFFHNIQDPANPEFVTIDGHMFNVYHNERNPLASRDKARRIVKVSPKLYAAIAGALKELAVRKGEYPSTVQAILWLTWRRMHGIRTPAQTEMWDRDYLSAGLGFVTTS